MSAEEGIEDVVLEMRESELQELLEDVRLLQRRHDGRDLG